MHKFIYENDYQGQLDTKVEFNIPSDADLTDMLEEFQNYLKAIGFSFDGNVDIVAEQVQTFEELFFDDTVGSEPLPYGYPAYNYDDVKVTYGTIE